MKKERKKIRRKNSVISRGKEIITISYQGKKEILVNKLKVQEA